MKNSIAKPYDYKGDFPIMMNLSQARRIVVKVGTSTLTYPTGKLNIRGIERLVRCIADLTTAATRWCSSHPVPSLSALPKCVCRSGRRSCA